MSGFTSEKKLPVYRHHKPSGQARVRWQGREIYLGKFDSPESRHRYAELLTKLVTGATLDIEGVGRRSRSNAPAHDDVLSINELCLLFLKHAEQHYRKNGKLTSEYDLLTLAIEPLKELFGMTPVEQFGPLALKAVRESMVAKGWTRGTVNAEVGRIRRVFRFAVENELLKDSSVLQKLEAVSPLLAGRTEAPDNDPRQAVPQEQIDAVKKLVSERCRDLIDLQLCRVRPGELMKLTSGMIDRSGEIWTTELREHKTTHHGKVRKLAFGAKSQLILRKYLSADPYARLFPFRADSYRHAIARACEQLDLPHWTPHWLRHNVATRVRDEFGIEHAQAMAGHSSPLMTAHYASKMDVLAVQVAKSIG